MSAVEAIESNTVLTSNALMGIMCYACWVFIVTYCYLLHLLLKRTSKTSVGDYCITFKWHCMKCVPAIGVCGCLPSSQTLQCVYSEFLITRCFTLKCGLCRFLRCLQRPTSSHVWRSRDVLIPGAARVLPHCITAPPLPSVPSGDAAGPRLQQLSQMAGLGGLMTTMCRTPASLGAPLMLSPRMAAGTALINSAPPPLISAGDAAQLMYAQYAPDYAAQYAAAAQAQLAPPPPLQLSDYAADITGGYFAR